MRLGCPTIVAALLADDTTPGPIIRLKSSSLFAPLSTSLISSAEIELVCDRGATIGIAMYLSAVAFTPQSLEH